jgi:small conductance mechanosensitive channel
MLGNNKIFSDTIQNFSANPYRRVDRRFSARRSGFACFSASSQNRREALICSQP